jgi:F-type H+-transporting ATPase subunit b
MENLGIDYKLLIAQVINFGLLFFLFRRFMAKPFMKFLTEEKKKDESREKLSQELASKHEKMLEDEAKWRKKVKQEQEKILEETKQSAEKMKAEILQDAKDEAEALMEKARQQLEEDRENFHKEVRTHIADVSVLVIEKALQKYLTGDAQKKLTAHVLSSLGKETKVS